MTTLVELPTAGNNPVRTCVGCKARVAKSSLLRLVVAGDGIVPDPQARQPGRGAYVHPSLACFELAQRRKAFPRALRVPGPLDTTPLASYLSPAKPESVSGATASAPNKGPTGKDRLDMTENLYGKQVEKL